MGGDTWVNVVHTQRPAPVKPARAASAPPWEDRGSGGRKDFGWFWINRHKETCGVSRSSFSDTPRSPKSGALALSARTARQSAPTRTSSRAASPAPLSRTSSAGSWQEVTFDASPTTSDDMTDLEDASLVSIAPRKHPRVRAVQLSRLTPQLAAAGVPASADISDLKAPSTVFTMDRVAYQEGGVALRLRKAGGAGELDDNEKASKGASSGQLASGRSSAACGMSTEPDLLWTFLAGMMLYFMSV
jgi:hypothetical protein